jgi:hypothetical protein
LYTKDVDKTWTPIFDIERSFVYRFKTYDRIQFPLRPSAAKTIHKSQGDTLDTVVGFVNIFCIQMAILFPRIGTNFVICEFYQYNTWSRHFSFVFHKLYFRRCTNLWKELFKMHELTEIMRQKDDMEFAQLLNRLRENELTENDIAILNTRVAQTDEPSYPSTSMHLFRENALVDSFNLQYIARLTSQKVLVPSIVQIPCHPSDA